MATLKHVASKNADYTKCLEYLMFEHLKNGAPVRDEEGNMLMREEFILDGINCSPFSFDKECEMLNWKYHKNQKYSDIKSHHYILSFDPLDREEGLLDTERAQKLGMEYAARCFPGHQMLVCTHNDGHNGSGNIHVHIIINSLRKLDVEREPFMEREIDSRAGYKHNLTPRYLEFLQREVMRMCEREGLHQVDLLSPAKEKVTNAEYHAKATGQKHLDELNEDILSMKMKPRDSVFQTQKQFLRDAITDAMEHSSSPEDFRKYLMDKYGIDLKDRRGRFSYLHPDRKKYITGRALGTAYEKEYLLKMIEENTEEEKWRKEMIRKDDLTESIEEHEDSMAKQPQTITESNHDNAGTDAIHTTIPSDRKHSVDRPVYDPSYDYHADPAAILYIRSELRLVVDLQNCIKAQMNRSYAEAVELSNLLEYSRSVAFLQEQGIGSREELRRRLSDQAKNVASSESALQDTLGQLKTTNEQIHYTGQYFATRTVQKNFLKAFSKKIYRSQHREELDRYDESVKFFNENTGGTVPSIQDLKQKKEQLLSTKEKQKKNLKDLKKKEKAWQTAAHNVNLLLGPEEPVESKQTIAQKRSEKSQPSL